MPLNQARKVWWFFEPSFSERTLDVHSEFMHYMFSETKNTKVCTVIWASGEKTLMSLYIPFQMAIRRIEIAECRGVNLTGVYAAGLYDSHDYVLWSDNSINYNTSDSQSIQESLDIHKKYPLPVNETCRLQLSALDPGRWGAMRFVGEPLWDTQNI